MSEGLVDESKEPALTVTVSKLIEQRQMDHQRRFLETQQLRLNTATVNLRSDTHKDLCLRKLKFLEAESKPKAHYLRCVGDFQQLISSVARQALNIVLRFRELLEKQAEESQLLAAVKLVQSINASLEQEVINLDCSPSAQPPLPSSCLPSLLCLGTKLLSLAI